MYRLSITIPKEVAHQFHEKVKKGDRSQFISKAILDALERQDRQEAIEAIKNFKPFETDRDSTQVLAEIRQDGVTPLRKRSNKV